MHDRVLSPRVLLLVAMALPIVGCTNPLAVSISVSPTTQSLGAGQTAQFTATGVYGHGSNHPSSTEDLTDSATWASSAPGVATISASGMATGVSVGTTTITASINGYTGVVSASATLTVSGSSGGGGTPLSIAIIPNTQLVTTVGDTAQFDAIETTATGSTVDVTNSATWGSSSPSIATIGASTGLATAVSLGTVTITATYPSGANTLTGTATFTVGSGAPGTGGSTEEYTAVTIVPGSQSISASGQMGQFIALATLGSNGLEEDVTNSPNIIWISSIPSVATVNGSGLATGVSLGTSTITAELANPDGSLVSNSSTVDVTDTPAPEPLLSLTIIPSSITVDNLEDQGQFLAIGTYSTAPTVRDLTNSVQWLTSSPNVFPVNSNGTGSPSAGANAGIVTAYGVGSATIIAEATGPTTGNPPVPGTVQTATATFSCPLVLPTPTVAGSCYPGSEASALLSTLTVYNEGLNTTDWLVTAPSATGTPNVLHCGPGSTGAGLGGSVCVATYPVGTTVTLTAPAGAGAFGGWSYNCIPTSAVTAAGPNTCQVTLTFDDTVGVIFN